MWTINDKLIVVCLCSIKCGTSNGKIYTILVLRYEKKLKSWIFCMVMNQDIWVRQVVYYEVVDMYL